MIVAGISPSGLALAGPLQYPHAAGVNVAQGPVANGMASGSSLPDALINASSRVSSWVQRNLNLATYTAERGRLIVDRDGYLIVRTREWPVVTFTALSVITGDGTLWTLDPTQVVLEAGERLFTYTGPSGQQAPGINFGRGTKGWVQVSYTAGYSPLHRSIQEAAALFAADIVNRRVNYLGASAFQGDHSRTEQRLRGDKNFDDIMTARAKELLERFVRRD